MPYSDIIAFSRSNISLMTSRSKLWRAKCVAINIILYYAIVIGQYINVQWMNGWRVPFVPKKKNKRRFILIRHFNLSTLASNPAPFSTSVSWKGGWSRKRGNIFYKCNPTHPRNYKGILRKQGQCMIYYYPWLDNCYFYNGQIIVFLWLALSKAVQ